VKALAWLIFIASIAVVGYAVVQWRKRWAERQRMAQARITQFLAQVRPPTAAAPATASAAMPQERLLLEAAGKAGEAGEPALAIQLYARLIARFPQSAFAAQARAAVAEQKKKLAT
jgi:hypothetical protein